MLFNSFNFAIFLPIAFALYWLIGSKNIKIQNLFLLVASYFFYACWDYRFLFLLIFSTLLDFFSGIKIENSKTQAGKKLWLWIAVGINLGFLAVFKYYNFFTGSFSNLLAEFGIKHTFGMIDVLLPVGISFYTFHGLSYIFDIYKQRIKPVNNFVDYSVFVSFFPLLVAGPIERATHLLPQIREKRTFDYRKAIDGLRQILWGLFKKIVIADNCAEYANMIFNHYATFPGSTLVLGTIFFAFQIYCDFSGYSDIALGTARLFGIELLRNFAYPFFSRDISEFWRRWHISLSSWFKDYVYFPLGGSRGTLWKTARNTVIIFILSGLWHGANWTYIAWGALNAIYVLPLVLSSKSKQHIDIVAKGKIFPTLKEFLLIIGTFGLNMLAWVFFRSETITDVWKYLVRVFSPSILEMPDGASLMGGSHHPYTVFLLVAFMVLVEWQGRENQFGIAKTGLKWHRPVRWAFYSGLIVAIFFFSGKSQQFIYFQF